jgi:hypothetical protein
MQKMWPKRIKRWFLVLESWLVALFGTVMSAGCVMVPIAMHSDRMNEAGPSGSFSFYGMMIFIAIIECCAVFWTWKCIRRALYPIGFSAALMQPRWKWGLRYPIAFWWSIKFSFGFMMLWMLHSGAAYKEDHDEPMGFGQSFFMGLVLSHLTFGNLMLALGCFASRETLAAVWKKRLVLELSVAAAASAISQLALPNR